MMFNAKLMLLVVMLWTGSLTLASSRHQSNMMRKIRANPVCDKYELPENAVWVPRANCEDNREFQCQPGYQSSVQTTCNKNGEWDLEPSCQAVECPSGEEIENSVSVTPSDIIFGADFNFDCMTGFTKNGLKGTLKCGESGKWIVTTPCKGCDYKYSNDSFVKTDYGTILNSPQSIDLAACNERCKNDTNCTFAAIVDKQKCYIYQYPVIYASFGSNGADPDQCINRCTNMSDCLTMVNVPFNNYCYLYSITLEEIPDSQKNPDRGIDFTVAEKIC